MDIRTSFFSGILTAYIAALISPAVAQTGAQGDSSHPPMTVYVQVSDARFDSYLRVKKNKNAGNEADSSDELFYIAPSNSKEREREFADWRRKFNLIVSAATLSESVKTKISQVKEEFTRANRAAECWIVDHDKERRITVTIIGSASKTTIENEYQAASRDFFADPNNFTCKYTYRVRPSTPEP